MPKPKTAFGLIDQSLARKRVVLVHEKSLAVCAEEDLSYLCAGWCDQGDKWYGSYFAATYKGTTRAGQSWSVRVRRGSGS